MKNLFLLFIICLSFACGNNANQKTDEPAQTPTASTPQLPENTSLDGNYCFVASYGVDSLYQDTTAVRLTIIGNKVTGTYDWIPAGKDSGRGTLSGTIADNIITALYDYTIEGSNQQEEKVFRLEDNQLVEKRGELHEVNGVLKLKNPETATFSAVLPKVDCG
ncbi:MAG: hypothetical protein AAF960_11250 [Bacteroidota bacterium]